MTPRLSVVVPFYGVETFIGDCLRSIRDQHLTDIEVILVDDGSPDGSADIARDFVQRDDRFRIVTQPNAGLGPARNTGTAHATGEYLTFVDSDDLVTRHGFERLVAVLDTTGSSFAGGNARRFNNASGVRQSWTHRRAFAGTLPMTHIVELPHLAADRMVWNKVYRRRFWDEKGLEFPAIRYEDYPVTLRAHLEAVTVDVLREPVYYWRERESGDSITQQAFRYDNLLDRVVSAEMVLTLLRGTTAAVARAVRSGLAQSDFITIVQAFASVPEEEAQQLVDLGLRLVGGLGEDAVTRHHPYDLLQYRALLARDVDYLRELAEFRGAGGLGGSARAVRVGRSGRYWSYPGLDREALPRQLFRAPSDEIALRSSVTDVAWVGGTLRITGTAEIRHVETDEDSELTVEVGRPRHWREVPVERFVALDSHGELRPVGFRLELAETMLDALPSGTTHVRLTVKARGHRKRGRLNGVTPGSAQWPPGRVMADDRVAQPARTSRGELVVTWLQDPVRLVAATADGPSFRLRLQVQRSVTRAEVTISTSPDDRVAVPARCSPSSNGGTTLSAEVVVTDVLDGIDADDPFAEQTVRAVRVALDGGEPELVYWDAEPESAGVLSPQGEHLIRVTRSPANRINIVDSRARFTAESAHTDQDRGALVVAGRTWLPDDGAHVGWRQFHPNSDEFVEAPGELVVADGRWRLETPLASLLTSEVEHLPTANRLAPDATWVLFFTVPGRPGTAVVADPFLSRHLPLRFAGAGRHAAVVPTGQTVHLRVTHDD